LHKAYKENKVLATAFSNPETHIKILTEELEGAPWGTTQLFLVQSPEKSFIVKGMKEWQKKIADLVHGTQVPGIKPYLYPHLQNNKYPQFLFPINYLSYDDPNGHKQYVSLMPKASGYSLASLMKAFAQHPGDKRVIKQVVQAYFDTGAVMACFYRATNGTITHGDFHHGNIFYKPETRQVTLIDNERVATSSVQANNISQDSAFLLMKSLYVAQWTQPDLVKSLVGNSRIHEWYALYLPSFIAGYISVLPQHERHACYDWLVHALTHYVSSETGKCWYTDESTLGFSHKKYMEPLFNQLKTSDLFFALDSHSAKSSDRDKKTMLHYAALSNQWLAMWPLICAGADVHVQDNELNTPLHEASYSNSIEAIKILARAGADLHAKNSKGETPLAKAQANNSTQALAVLKHYGARY